MATKQTNVLLQEMDDNLFKHKRFNREHIAFFLLAITTYLGISTFWNFQDRIWNRVVYRVGPWENSIPFYNSANYPSSTYIGSMLNQAILLLLVSVLFTIAISIFVGIIFSDNERIRSVIIMLFLSLVMSLVTFWSLKSIYLSPENWFREELALVNLEDWKFAGITLPYGEDATTRFEFFSIILTTSMILSLICSVLTAILLIYRFYMKYTTEDEGVIKATVKATDISDRIRQAIFYLIMIAFMIYTIIPVIYTFSLSMSSFEDINANRFLPTNPLDNFIVNYSSVMFVNNGDRAPSFSSSFMISAILGSTTALGGLAIALPAAYAISRFRFIGRKGAQFLVLATQMFPGIILLLPQFLLFVQVGFLNGQDWDLGGLGTVNSDNKLVLSVLIAYFVGALAYNVWMMKGYFDTLPIDLEEAALIDGSSTFGSFTRIAIPLAAPGMVAVGLFTFLGAWNEFALAQIFIGESNNVATLPLLFYQYQDTTAPDNPPFFQLLSAFSILAALPIVLVFMTLNRFLTSGLTQGGIK